MRDTVYVDFWFPSVKAATLVKQAGHEFVGPVKRSQKNFPKNQLETLMKDWPGGMYFVLEGVAPPSAPVGKLDTSHLRSGTSTTQGRFSPLFVPMMLA